MTAPCARLGCGETPDYHLHVTTPETCSQPPFKCQAPQDHHPYEAPARSSQPAVRNPVLALPSAAALADLDPQAKAAMRAVLMDIRAEARVKADESWRRSKGPMAAYWKAVATYAGHIARAVGS